MNDVFKIESFNSCVFFGQVQVGNEVVMVWWSMKLQLLHFVLTWK